LARLHRGHVRQSIPPTRGFFSFDAAAEFLVRAETGNSDVGSSAPGTPQTPCGCGFELCRRRHQNSALPRTSDGVVIRGNSSQNAFEFHLVGARSMRRPGGKSVCRTRRQDCVLDGFFERLGLRAAGALGAAIGAPMRRFQQNGAPIVGGFSDGCRDVKERAAICVVGSVRARAFSGQIEAGEPPREAQGRRVVLRSNAYQEGFTGWVHCLIGPGRWSCGRSGGGGSNIQKRPATREERRAPANRKKPTTAWGLPGSLSFTSDLHKGLDLLSGPAEELG